MDDPGPSSSYYNHFAATAEGPVRPQSPPSSPLLGPSHSDPQKDVDSFQADSLYAILNVDRNASVSEINTRYRILATTFHPDKQRDEAARTAAHGRFQEIHRAYKILTDERQRTIYDLFGEEGLRTSWDVGPRNKSPEELRRFFQRQAYETRQVEAEALVKPKGNISVVLDARAVFLKRTMFQNPDAVKHDVISRIRRVNPGRVTMRHSFETAVGKKTQVVWTGEAGVSNRKGGANVLGTIRHQVSPRLWFDVGASLLRPRVLTANSTYTYDENTSVTVNAVAETSLAPPRASVTLARRLYSFTTGFITYKSGFFSIGPWGASLPPQVAQLDQSALSIGMTTARRDGTGWTAQTQAGLINSNISSDWSTRVLGLRIKIGAEAGVPQGVSGFLEADGKATTNVRAGFTLQAFYGGGITVRLRLSRLGQTIRVPILLTHDLNPYVLAGATLIPAASYLALYQFVIQPRKKRKLAQRVEELRKDHAEHIAQKKAEAQEALLVLERPTAQKAAAEKEKHGLVILFAHYGRADAFTDRGMKAQPSSPDGAEDESYIDVTIPIQALVNDGKLVIPSGRAKYNLLGFWDPCIGEGKKLRVRYLFKDVLHQVTVDDLGALRLPLKAHVLEQ